MNRSGGGSRKLLPEVRYPPGMSSRRDYSGASNLRANSCRSVQSSVCQETVSKKERKPASSKELEDSSHARSMPKDAKSSTEVGIDSCRTLYERSPDRKISRESAKGRSYGKDSGYGDKEMSRSPMSSMASGGHYYDSGIGSEDPQYKTDQRITNDDDDCFGLCQAAGLDNDVEESNDLVGPLENMSICSNDVGWWKTTSDRSGGDVSSQQEDEILRSVLPHVKAKRTIYKKFLQAYFPSISKTGNNRVIIIDGPAGTGRATEHSWPKEIENYETPLIALRVALHYFRKKGNQDVCFNNHLKWDLNTYLDNIEALRKNTGVEIEIDSSDNHKVILVFVENDRNLYKELVINVITVIKMYGLRLDMIENFENGRCKVRCDFKRTGRILSEYLVVCYIVNADITQLKAPREKSLTVFNTDNDTAVPLDVLKNFIGSQNQVFISLNSTINSHNGNNSNFTKGGSLESIVTANFVSNYEHILKQSSKHCHVLSLEMQGVMQSTAGHILFAANHIHSFRYMKEAMTVVKQGSANSLVFGLSLRIPGHFQVTEEIPNDKTAAAADAIYRKFRGREASISEIKSFVFLETIFVFRKAPLKILEMQGKITVRPQTPERRKGTFPDHTKWILVFSP